MTKWGVFDGKDPPHVMPVSEDGFAIGGHLAAEYCWCEPTRNNATQDGRERVVIVHNDVQQSHIQEQEE